MGIEIKERGSLGAVYVEFLIVFFPMMLLWLGVTQIGLMYGGSILVHTAAVRAARAAIVVISDDREGHEERYDNVPPYQIGGGGEGLSTYENAPAGGRLHAIRRAARMTLAPISPSLGASGLGGIAEVFVGYIWTDYAVAVTFPSGDGDYLTQFDDQTGPLVAKVTYLYKCPVPVANRILCSNYFNLQPEAQEELETVGGDLIGLAGMGTEAADWLFDADVTGWRFIALTAQKTLPLQGKYQ
jgi:hypothetical protein